MIYYCIVAMKVERQDEDEISPKRLKHGKKSKNTNLMFTKKNSRQLAECARPHKK